MRLSFSVLLLIFHVFLFAFDWCLYAFVGYAKCVDLWLLMIACVLHYKVTFWVYLITGLKIGMESWMERWNGTVEWNMEWKGHCMQQPAQWHITHVASKLGSAIYYDSRALISLKRLYEQVQCWQHTFWSEMMSLSENGASLHRGPLNPSAATRQVMTSYSIMHGTHT